MLTDLIEERLSNASCCGRIRICLASVTHGCLVLDVSRREVIVWLLFMKHKCEL